MSEGMNEWTDECINERINKWMNEIVPAINSFFATSEINRLNCSNVWPGIQYN